MMQLWNTAFANAQDSIVIIPIPGGRKEENRQARKMVVPNGCISC